MVECSECNLEMKQTYTKEKIKEMAGNNPNPVFELELKRSFTCPHCGFERKLSNMEIAKEFVKFRMKSGKSTKDIVEEVQDKKKEFQ